MRFPLDTDTKIIPIPYVLKAKVNVQDVSVTSINGNEVSDKWTVQYSLFAYCQTAAVAVREMDCNMCIDPIVYAASVWS